MWKFLNTDSTVSTMRVCFFLGTCACCVLMMAMAFYICVMALKGQIKLEWSEMAILLGGIAGILGWMGINKNKQSKIENEETTIR